MGAGKPRTSNRAVQARKAVIDALRAGQALTEPEARELVDKLVEESRSVGWKSGYDDGHFDGTYED
jgi:hypothetical protein